MEYDELYSMGTLQYIEVQRQVHLEYFRYTVHRYYIRFGFIAGYIYFFIFGIRICWIRNILASWILIKRAKCKPKTVNKSEMLKKRGITKDFFIL